MSMITSQTPTFGFGYAAPATTPRHQSNSWPAFLRPSTMLRGWAERRAQRKTLGELAEDRHLLQDIGLTRAQALREAAKPFWRA